MDDERRYQSLLSSLIEGQAILFYFILHFATKHPDVKILIIKCELHELIMDISKQQYWYKCLSG